MKILFGVFDWGLGHATRDTPLIEGLLNKGHNVDIISTGRALELLKKRFENKCKFFDVKSMKVPYPKNNHFAIKFTGSIPKMLLDLKNARKKSELIIKKEKYDKVISDCRYDVYDEVNNSYLINHQVRFVAPKGCEPILEKWLASRMKKYKYIVVPDYDKKNITGILSHELKYVEKKKLKYVGIISQVQKKDVKEDIDYFISISGPEPQRTVLEKKILPELKNLKGKIVVTLGKPETTTKAKDGKITIHNFLDSKKQGDIMNRAKFIVSRSGYTTVMELIEVEKKNVLFIPTPGQTEQEYLADLYEQNNYFHHVHQDDLNLVADINKAKGFNGFNPEWKTKESVKKFLKMILPRLKF